MKPSVTSLSWSLPFLNIGLELQVTPLSCLDLLSDQLTSWSYLEAAGTSLMCKRYCFRGTCQQEQRLNMYFIVSNCPWLPKTLREFHRLVPCFWIRQQKSTRRLSRISATPPPVMCHLKSDKSWTLQVLVEFYKLKLIVKINAFKR